LASIVERRQRRRAHPRRVIGLAGLFDESVEISIAQKLLETVAKHMARRAWHLRPGHHEVLLDLALTPHRHRRSPSRISVLQTESAGGDFVNTLLKCPAVADRPEEAGDKLFTFTRFPQSQWKSIRTSNAIERLHEEFKRRIKTQTVLPCAETAAMLFWALMASGQIVMRKVDGWESLAEKPADQIIGLAA
jgi:hypothetical protein